MNKINKYKYKYIQSLKVVSSNAMWGLIVGIFSLFLSAFVIFEMLIVGIIMIVLSGWLSYVSIVTYYKSETKLAEETNV